MCCLVENITYIDPNDNSRRLQQSYPRLCENSVNGRLCSDYRIVDLGERRLPLPSDTSTTSQTGPPTQRSSDIGDTTMDTRRRSPSSVTKKKKPGWLSGGLFGSSKKSAKAQETSLAKFSSIGSEDPSRPIVSSRPSTSSPANRAPTAPIAPGVGIPIFSASAPRYPHPEPPDLPSPPSSLQSPSSQDPVDIAYQPELRLPPTQRSHRRQTSSASSYHVPSSSSYTGPPAYQQNTRLATPPYTPRSSWGRGVSSRTSQPSAYTYNTADSNEQTRAIPPAAPEIPIPEPQDLVAERTRGQGREEARLRHREEQQRSDTQSQTSQADRDLEQALRETTEELRKARHDLARYERREQEWEERLSRLEEDGAQRSEKRRRRHRRHKSDEGRNEPAKKSHRHKPNDSASQQQTSKASSSRRNRSPSPDTERRTKDKTQAAEDYMNQRRSESHSQSPLEPGDQSGRSTQTPSQGPSRRNGQRHAQSHSGRSENARRISETRKSVEMLRAKAEEQKQRMKQRQSFKNLQPTVEEEEVSEYETESPDQDYSQMSLNKPLKSSVSQRQPLVPDDPPPRTQSYHRGDNVYIQTERARPSTSSQRQGQQPRLRRTSQNIDLQDPRGFSSTFNKRMQHLDLQNPPSRFSDDGEEDEDTYTDWEDEASPGIGPEGSPTISSPSTNEAPRATTTIASGSKGKERDVKGSPKERRTIYKYDSLSSQDEAGKRKTGTKKGNDEARRK